MAVANLNNEGRGFDTGNDSIVIVKALSHVVGGTTLDVEDFTDSVVKAGHIIIQKDGTREFKPMPVSEGAYGSLPSGYSYAGVLKVSVTTTKPFASVVTRGDINEAACPYPVTEDMKEALHLIAFV